VVFRAAEEDANPFEGESSDGNVAESTFGALLSIVSSAPEGLRDGLPRPLDEGLAEKLKARARVTALLGVKWEE
jgi:hypothetical protein